MPQFAAFISINVFKRAAVFLKEITTDNVYTNALASTEITDLVQTFVLTVENADFFWNIFEFWVNITPLDSFKLQLVSKRSEETIALLKGASPVQFFKAHHIQSYKLADNHKETVEEDKEEEEVDDDREMPEAPAEDPNLQN